MNQKIIAAQIPFQDEELLAGITLPRTVEISIGTEESYSESLGFPVAASLLLSVYVDGKCALELSLPAEEAERLEAFVVQWRPRNVSA